MELYRKGNFVKVQARISTFSGESNIGDRNTLKQFANIPGTFSTMHLALVR